MKFSSGLCLLAAAGASASNDISSLLGDGKVDPKLISTVNSLIDKFSQV